MIKHIYANGPFIRVESTGHSYSTPYINMSNASAGFVRGIHAAIGKLIGLPVAIDAPRPIAARQGRDFVIVSAGRR